MRADLGWIPEHIALGLIYKHYLEAENGEGREEAGQALVHHAGIHLGETRTGGPPYSVHD